MIVETACPCGNCVCKSICRHKSFISLFKECDLLQIYEPYYPTFTSERLITLSENLSPTNWYYDEKGIHYQRKAKRGKSK